MSYETISNRLKDILLTVAGVYNVHTYYRDINSEEKFAEAFMVDLQDKKLLTAWIMTRTEAPATRPNMDAGSMLDVMHKFEIQGFYGIYDEGGSELEFQGIVDNILNAFRTKPNLEDTSGVALTGVIGSGEPQVLDIGHGQFSNYFVHFCRLQLSVKERLS